MASSHEVKTTEKPSVSVIIPTFNRPEHLDETLGALLGMSVLPDEVLVVDDSTDERVADLVRLRSQRFLKEGVSLRYMRNPRERGSSAARNVGLEHTSSEIVMFLDDDVLLDRGYLDAVLDVYRAYPDAAGVQGHMHMYGEGFDVQSVYNALRRAFALTYASEKGCEVLRSFKASYPVRVEGVEACSWLSGTNQTYRRSSLGDLRFDERLRRYSLGEDLDLSFNVGRRGEGKLYIVAAARLVHREAGTERTGGDRLLYVDSVNSYYLFRKNMPHTFLNRSVFCWSRLGRLILNISDWAKCRIGASAQRVSAKHIFLSQLLWLSNRSRIAAGDLGFLEEHLRNEHL
jgi:glucosyl-dolichyl phosphate glucuronosyltransferase